MKKMIAAAAVFLAAFSLFSQSAEYKKFLEKGKEYEKENKWCHALEAYYDAIYANDNPELNNEAENHFYKIKTAIEDGNPGTGKYNLITKNEEWKKLLIDAEQVGSSFQRYSLETGRLVRTGKGKYGATISYKNSEKYDNTVGIVQKGYCKAYKEGWPKDLPKPDNWPVYSVSYINDGEYDVNGSLVFHIPYEGKDCYINAFAMPDFDPTYGLYDYKFNIVDTDGKELCKSKRWLLTCNNRNISFSGLSKEVTDLIDEEKAFLKPVACYLKYGKYNREEDKGGRSFANKLSEKKLDMGNILSSGNSFIFHLNEMVPVPGKNIRMLKTEVTQILYKAVMGENPSNQKGDNNPVERVSLYDALYFCNKLSERAGLTPVYSVDGKTDVNSWGYIPHKTNKISGKIEQDTSANGFRLPTDEEWEYAAKGGENYIYSGSDDISEVGWFKNNSDERHHSVAQKKPNAFGLYDMSGNVCEWCWNDSLIGPHDDREGYIRGGNYDNVNDPDYDNYIAVSSRSSFGAPWQNSAFGFRVVCAASF